MAGCVPVKVKICWEMGRVPREFLSPGSFLGCSGKWIVEEFLPYVLGRLRMPLDSQKKPRPREGSTSPKSS